MRQILAIAALLASADAVWAQSALEPVEAKGGAEFTIVEQGGASADAIRTMLRAIKLPEGFRIALYAIAPGARHMAVGPDGTVFVGTRRNTVWTVTDRDGDGVADEVRNFAPGIAFTAPNGPCFAPDGTLYVAERNRVLAFPDAETHRDSPDVDAVAVVAEGKLVPPSEETRNHAARVCRVGPDDRLYISLGQPYNVSPPDKLDLYREVGIGGIIRIARDGSGREVYAYGLRNSVGHDFNPANGELWFTDNQVDGMGDDRPPGELNRQTQAGQDFGFPWYGGGDVRTDEYAGRRPPADVVMPAVEMTPHAADLGMTFYSGEKFPQKYRGGIFSAQHGSWDRSVPVGARVMFTAVGQDGSAGETEIFAQGWLADDGSYRGRPVDVAERGDGSILVSDDRAGAIYRITYGE